MWPRSALRCSTRKSATQEISVDSLIDAKHLIPHRIDLGPHCEMQKMMITTCNKSIQRLCRRTQTTTIMHPFLGYNTPKYMHANSKKTPANVYFYLPFQCIYPIQVCCSQCKFPRPWYHTLSVTLAVLECPPNTLLFLARAPLSPISSLDIASSKRLVAHAHQGSMTKFRDAP